MTRMRRREGREMTIGRSSHMMRWRRIGTIGIVSTYNQSPSLPSNTSSHLPPSIPPPLPPLPPRPLPRPPLPLPLPPPLFDGASFSLGGGGGGGGGTGCGSFAVIPSQLKCNTCSSLIHHSLLTFLFIFLSLHCLYLSGIIFIRWLSSHFKRGDV